MMAGRAFRSSRSRLFYERRRSREPLLLITGFIISSAVFEPVLPLYAEHFDVITYDNRWSARSPKPLRLTSIPELASDAARLLDSLGVESARVRRPLVARAVARANSRLIDYDLENYPLPIARVRPEERQEIGRLRECIATVRSADARATDAGSP